MHAREKCQDVDTEMLLRMFSNDWESAEDPPSGKHIVLGPAESYYFN